jgi:hypothetical protein
MPDEGIGPDLTRMGARTTTVPVVENLYHIVPETGDATLQLG